MTQSFLHEHELRSDGATLNRRLTLLAGAGALLGGSRAASASSQGLDLSDPRQALIASRKCAGTLEDGVQTFSWMDGVVFAVFDDGRRVEPMHGVVGLFPMRSWGQPDGTYRSASWNAIFYTELGSGRVLEEFRNPYTGRTVRVFNHASVLNSHVRAATGVRETQTTRLDSRWLVAMDNVICVTEMVMRKPNPLDPAKWKKESDGVWFEKKQSTHVIARLSELVERDRPSVESVSISSRFGPWYPWMLMGTAAGRNFSHMVIQKSTSLAEVPRNIVDYAERKFPQALEAPKAWTGTYVDPETAYAMERAPE